LRTTSSSADRQWDHGDLNDHREKVEQAYGLGIPPAELIKWLGKRYDLVAHWDVVWAFILWVLAS